jgi:hypothetical protein
MGKGSDAAKGGGIVAIEYLKVTKLGRGTVEKPELRSDGYLRQIRNSHQAVLAGEFQRPIGALGLPDAENPM